MLLDARWDDGEPLSVLEIRDHLLTLLVAGNETTAISLAWAVHDVYRNPDVLRRLRDEIDGLGDSPALDALARRRRRLAGVRARLWQRYSFVP